MFKASYTKNLYLFMFVQLDWAGHKINVSKTHYESWKGKKIGRITGWAFFNSRNNTLDLKQELETLMWAFWIVWNVQPITNANQ